MEGQVSFGKAFLMGVRRVMGRAMVKSLVAADCYDSDGSWNTARCDPTVQRDCMISAGTAEEAARGSQVPTGQKLWEHLAESRSLAEFVDKVVVDDSAEGCVDSLTAAPGAGQQDQCLTPTAAMRKALEELESLIKGTAETLAGSGGAATQQTQGLRGRTSPQQGATQGQGPTDGEALQWDQEDDKVEKAKQEEQKERCETASQAGTEAKPACYSLGNGLLEDAGRQRRVVASAEHVAERGDGPAADQDICYRRGGEEAGRSRTPGDEEGG